MRRILTLIFVVILLTGGMMYVSRNSLPGDILYPIKISVEDLQINLTQDDEAADLYLKFAAERVVEMNRLLEKGKTENILAASQRLKAQMEKLIILLDNSGTQEQVYTLINITENYSLIVDQLKRSVLTSETSSDWIEAVVENQSFIDDLFLSNNIPSLRQMIEVAGGIRSPELLIAASQDENDFGLLTVTPLPQFTASPVYVSVTPVEGNSTMVVTVSSTVVVSSPQVWPTHTSTYPPSTNPPRAATATYTFVSTVQSTNTGVPNPQPTNQPSATSQGYPPPQQTATTAGYPPPPQPTIQPSATSQGYPPPPQQTPTSSGYPPPQPTTQPTNPPVPTQQPTATQSGYPPPQATQQPSPPAYP